MGVLQTPALPLGHVALEFLVPRRGFEPLRPKARPPQDRVSTNSTTSAGGTSSESLHGSRAPFRLRVCRGLPRAACWFSSWQEWRDSNPRPAVLETAALPA